MCPALLMPTQALTPCGAHWQRAPQWPCAADGSGRRCDSLDCRRCDPRTWIWPGSIRRRPGRGSSRGTCSNPAERGTVKATRPLDDSNAACTARSAAVGPAAMGPQRRPARAARVSLWCRQLLSLGACTRMKTTWLDWLTLPWLLDVFGQRSVGFICLWCKP